MNDVVTITNFSKRFGDLQVLRDISLSVKQGEIISIIGPSGSGKSTVLRSLNLLEVPTEGHIYFEGVDITDKIQIGNACHKFIEVGVIGNIRDHFFYRDGILLYGNTADADIALRKIQNTARRLQRRCFACAVMTDKAVKIACLHMKRQMIHSAFSSSVYFGKIIEF